MHSFKPSSLTSIPALFGSNEKSNIFKNKTIQNNYQNTNSVKVWYTSTCTSKSLVRTSFSSRSQPYKIEVIPGKIRICKQNESRLIDINNNLICSHDKAEVSFEYTLPNNLKSTIKVYLFPTEKEAIDFLSAVQDERDRTYFHFDTFDERFEVALNDQIRTLIVLGNPALQDMYLSCFNEHTPAGVIKALYSNYRITVGGKGTAGSFAALLHAVANDPVMLILFLCCKIDLNQAMLSAVDAAKTDVLDDKCDLLNPFLTSLTATVTAEAWQHKRELLLAQFRFPSITPGSSGLTTPEVLHWAQDFTTNYPKLFVNGHVLHHLLEDEKYLCYTFLHHHAVSGDRFVELVQQVFAGVPKSYLFSSFTADDGATSTDTPTQSCRHHFVDFLFNPNLSARSVFQTLLTAFKDSKGYDDKFFDMFLAEAISKDCPRVAVDVLTRILFTERGEPSLRALQSCGRIPVIIFKALVVGILNPSANGRPVSDDMRLLLEIAIHFEDYACNSDLSYLTTIGKLFAEEPESVQKFPELVETMKFLPFAAELCNHNLPEYAAMVAEQEERADQEMRRQSMRCPKAVRVGRQSTLRCRMAPSATATAHLAEVSMEASDASVKEGDGPSAPLALPEASIFVGEAEVVMYDRFYTGDTEACQHNQPPTQSQPSAVTGWKDRSVENLSALVYGFVTLVISSGALPNPTEATALQNETLASFLSAVPSSFFSVLLQPGAEMRARLIAFLKAKFHILNPYDHLLDKRELLCKTEHLSYPFLHALSYKPRCVADLAVDLVAIAARLGQTDELWSCLQHLDNTVGNSGDVKEQLAFILGKVKLRIDRTMQKMKADTNSSVEVELLCSTVTLQTLAGYAEVLAKALQGKRSRSERDAVLSAADELLLQTPVNTWGAGFQNL